MSRVKNKQPTKMVPVPSHSIIPERDLDKSPILECSHLGIDFGGLRAVDDFNQSILVLVYVVLGGLGNIWGSIVATVVLYVLPEALREYADLRMLLYAIILILVMLATHNPRLRDLAGRIIPRRRGAEADG